MTRLIAASVSLWAAWTVFGVDVDQMFAREMVRCSQFGSLSAGGCSPLASLFNFLGLIVVSATLSLAILVLRPPLRSDQN